ncbi:MAG: lipid A biosynthesis acyltransferase [Alphaproteobacteria bacterium CG_4_9_14_3_um_filter_47_13]|nr:MAG: lipid A biosynthesis acyltransferase [Alphaproteobacteria bacterium CG_4_9_14_3_um_filter_47_13]
MRKIKHFLEAAFLVVLLLIFKIMPLDMASAVGGGMGRMVGTRLGASRKALQNIKKVFPALSETECQKILVGMWDNLGRIMAEYPHLEKIGKQRVTIQGSDTVMQFLKEGKPCMMIAGHLGNWEIAAAAMLAQFSRPLDLTYRAPNNPLVDNLLMSMRKLRGQIRCYPKSRDGGQAIIKAMREGRYLAILIDQKYNEGIAVPFFGSPAMTNPAFIQLGRKFNYPIVPAQIMRIKGANFKITLYDPLAVEDHTNEQVIEQAHHFLENWILQNPPQWLWLHKRWDSKKLESRNIKKSK